MMPQNLALSKLELFVVDLGVLRSGVVSLATMVNNSQYSRIWACFFVSQVEEGDSLNRQTNERIGVLTAHAYYGVYSRMTEQGRGST
jgi:hypothetical protein